MLRPIQSETREKIDLSGVWEFRLDHAGNASEIGWHNGPLPDATPMAVPASYNDIVTDAADRDHIGEAWYSRTFFIPAAWQGKRVFLRFDAVCHNATVWINGTLAGGHSGGYLPFEIDLEHYAHCGAENRVTVAVDNVLTPTSIPPGEIKTEIHSWGNVRWQDIQHDFFNYSGLHRPVWLCAEPLLRFTDLTTSTEIAGSTARIHYSADLSDHASEVEVRLLDGGREIVSSERSKGILTVPEAKLWHPETPHLYTLELIASRNGEIIDIYRLPVGLRTVAVSDGKFLINGRPFYFKGCAKHEDSDIRGKGLDHALNIRDFNLQRWMGCNSTRTSHYPYSEEFLDLCDQYGVALIDESPAVGLQYFGKGIPFFTPERSPGLLANHLQTMRELIARDKNRASVVMWSVANEAGTDEPASRDYFQQVIAETRQLDSSRPVTNVFCAAVDKELTAHLCDVVCINRYNGWYWHPGRREIIRPSMVYELTEWYKRFGKPIIVTEFGADTIEGLHLQPAAIFSEEWQVEYLRENCAVFDEFDFVIGEHVWNFADFQTKQGITRVNGNRKGVFTRARQPKAAAHFLRERWLRHTLKTGPATTTTHPFGTSQG